MPSATSTTRPISPPTSRTRSAPGSRPPNSPTPGPRSSSPRSDGVAVGYCRLKRGDAPRTVPGRRRDRAIAPLRRPCLDRTGRRQRSHESGALNGGCRGVRHDVAVHVGPQRPRARVLRAVGVRASSASRTSSSAATSSTTTSSRAPWERVARERGSEMTAEPKARVGRSGDAAPLECPVCGRALGASGTACTCPSGHSFDIAREGYVNLLAPQHRTRGIDGDTAEMLRARRRFLGAGHYAPLRDLLAEKTAALLGGNAAARPPRRRHVLEVGCGEGYYIGGIADRVAAVPRRTSTSWGWTSRRPR